MGSVLTTVGKNWITDKIDETLSSTASYVHWGTSTASAAAGDTTLNASASEARVLATISQPAADTNRWVATLTADGAKDIGEVGTFDALTDGNMMIHANFTSITLATNDTIQFTINLQTT